jgi:hypothetical protein
MNKKYFTLASLGSAQICLNILRKGVVFIESAGKVAEKAATTYNLPQTAPPAPSSYR